MPPYSIAAWALLELIAAAKERDLFADEMSKRGLALDAALAELASLRTLLDEALDVARDWFCSCRTDCCTERGQLQPVVEARSECPRLRARTVLAKLPSRKV